MNSSFAGYDEYRGDFPSRFTGSIVCDREGVAVPYALFNLEPRGRLFLVPGEPVYEGMTARACSHSGSKSSCGRELRDKRRQMTRAGMLDGA